MWLCPHAGQRMSAHSQSDTQVRTTYLPKARSTIIDSRIIEEVWQAVGEQISYNLG